MLGAAARSARGFKVRVPRWQGLRCFAARWRAECGEGYAIGGDGLPNGCGVLCRGGQPATTSGVAMYMCGLVLPACRRHPGRRNTGLRTAATPHGVAKMSASGYRLHRCGGCARWWAVRCSASQSRCAEAAPDGKPRSGVPDRNPALTQLCRGLGNGSHDCVPKVRPCSARVC